MLQGRDHFGRVARCLRVKYPDFQSFDRLWFRTVASNPPLLCSEVEAGHVETSLLCQVRSVDLLPVPQLNVGIQDQDLGETNPMQGLRFP